MTFYYINFLLLLPKKSPLSKLTLPSMENVFAKKIKDSSLKYNMHTLTPSFGYFCFVTCPFTFGLNVSVPLIPTTGTSPLKVFTSWISRISLPSLHHSGPRTQTLPPTGWGWRAWLRPTGRERAKCHYHVCQSPWTAVTWKAI